MVMVSNAEGKMEDGHSENNILNKTFFFRVGGGGGGGCIISSE